MMKRLIAATFVLVVVLCGCGGAAVPDEPSVTMEGASQTDVWSSLKDISGAVIDFEKQNIKSLNINYALGWNFDAEGYRTIRRGDTVGLCTVTEAVASYHVLYEGDAFYNVYGKGDGLPVVICNRNDYWLECNGAISGILQISGDSIVFFPYDNPGNNFLLLSIRNEENEAVFADTSHILINGKDVQVQPIGIVLNNEEDGSVVSTVPGLDAGDIDSPQYYDAQVDFISLNFSAISDGEDAEIFGTRAWGSIDSARSITIRSKQ